jgi:hypothetical protein
LRLGVSFSPRRAQEAGLEWRPALQRLLSLGLDPVRLSAYWADVEREGYEDLDWQLDQVAAAGRSLVLTVGMKAIGWPEFYVPSYLQPAGRARGEIAASRPALTAGVLEFLQETVERYRGHPALTAWQVENEPLNISGPHRWWIAPQILSQELAAVRAADPRRKVVLTAFAHFNRLLDTLSTPGGQGAGRLLELLSPGDVLGLDVYQRIGRRQFGFNRVARADSAWSVEAERWRRRAEESDRQAWVTEAQAEPWGPAEFDPNDLATLLEGLRGAGYETVLLWGAEHWLARSAAGDEGWLEAVTAFQGR